MPLSPDFTTAISTDRTTLVITDATDFGVSGNPARASVLVFVTGFKTNIDSEETELTVVGSDEDPATDTSWTVTLTDDGSYKFCYVVIEDAYSALTTYAQYDAVYSGATVYRSKTAGNVGNAVSDTTYWEEITDVADLANNKGTATESLNITSTIYLRVFSENGKYYFANYLSDQCACTDCDPDDTLQKYDTWRMLLDGAAVADARSEVIQGERICRIIESRYIDCD